MDRYRLVFPPVLGVIMYNLFCSLYSNLFDEFYPAFFAGSMIGYLAYDMTHYFIHHEVPPFDYYKFLKKYHVLHHYKDPHLGYGVSNHLWDHVFGTVLIYK